MLGIGSDWTRYGKQKTALLLLSTYYGLCAIIRLSALNRIPTELQVCYAELLSENAEFYLEIFVRFISKF